MATPAPYIFIAYNSLDQDYVSRLAERLRQESIPVWSMESITPGVTFQRELEEHIRACAAFVPVISRNDSPWVRAEVGLALSSGRPILPITLHGAKPFFEIADRHAVRVFTNKMPGVSFFAELRRHVEEYVGPTTSGPPGSVVHTIEDITDSTDLVRFAVESQLHHARLPVERVADALHLPVISLKNYLGGRWEFSTSMLREIDDVIAALGRRTTYHAGLAQFASRMDQFARPDIVAAALPPSWTHGLLSARAADELHLLLQASALLARFVAGDEAGADIGQVQDTFRRELSQVVDQLILLAAGPPTPLHMEAHILLGGLAKYAFGTVMDHIDESIRTSPLGFRTWRALSRLLAIAQEDARHDDTVLAENLRPVLLRLVRDMPGLRDSSIYPGRSLDIELMILIPTEWTSGTADDPVNAALMHRALGDDATLRERGTAALGLWQRAHRAGRGDDPAVRQQIDKVISAFTGENVRSDIAEGLSWVAETLRAIVDADVSVCNEWPAIDAVWYRAVQEIANDLDHERLPADLLPGAKSLFLQLLLQNAGVERRRAIDTLAAAGLVEVTARSLARVLNDGRLHSQEWLRIRALFALGFMQERNDLVETALVTATLRACTNIAAPEPKPAQITELQTALFAIGDVYGVGGAEQEARAVRGRLSRALSDLVTEGRTLDPSRYAVSRALAYLLTFTAQPRQAGARDLAETLLDQLSGHPDEVTRNLSRWALDFRFAPDGRIRPLLDGAHAQNPGD